MNTPYIRLIIVLVVLSGFVQADSGLVSRIVDRSYYNPYQISLAFDGDNAPLVAYRGQSGITVARAEQDGYVFDVLPAHFQTGLFDFQVTAYNEWWMLLGYSRAYFVAKSNWFDWTDCPAPFRPSGNPLATALSNNDIMHVAEFTGSTLYHGWFDVKSNQWTRHSLGQQIYSDFRPSIDTFGDKVLISFSGPQDHNRVVVKKNGHYTYLPVFASQPVQFRAAFDSAGRPVVAYSSHHELAYAVYIDSLGWVKSETTIPCESVLRLDHTRTGVAGVLYMRDQALHYATNLAGIWTTVLLDAVASNTYPDFKFDRNDKPVFAYIGHDAGFGGPVVKLAGTDIAPYNITDLNGDGTVDLQDFALFAAQWGMAANPQTDRLDADFNADGAVNHQDLHNFLSNWLWGD